MWSSPMLTMTAASGAGMTLVESNSPPKPTSSTTMSHAWRAKYSIAMQVTSSNSVGCSSRASASGWTRVVISASSPSEMGSLSICIRSLKRMMYGEVYSPVR